MSFNGLQNGASPKLTGSSSRLSKSTSKVNQVGSAPSSPSLAPPRGGSMPNLMCINDSVGQLWIKAEGSYYDPKKYAKAQSGLEISIDGKGKVYSSIATGPNPVWKEKMLVDVVDYDFTLRSTLFNLVDNKKKKLSDAEVSLDVRILSDGQLLAITFMRKKKFLASVKLFIQFKAQNYEFERLEKFVLTDMTLLAAIFDTYTKIDLEQMERVTSSIYDMFEFNDRLVDLMKHIISYEVERVDDVALMLRDQTPTVQLLSSYIKSFGNVYLRKVEKTLLPFLTSDRSRVELDPCKAKPQEDIQQNGQILREKADFVLTTLFSLHTYIHPLLRELCKFLIRTVEKRFPERAKIGLGAVLFLRYICPSLVSPPPTSGIAKIFNSDPDLRRTLILITKLIQALSNNVLFGEKESYMICMNDFILDNQPRLAEFYSNILNGQSEAGAEEDMKTQRVRRKVPPSVYVNLHTYLQANKDLLLDRMSKYPPKDDQKELPHVVLASILNELDQVGASNWEDIPMTMDTNTINIRTS